jgi:hypothetical protein
VSSASDPSRHRLWAEAPRDRVILINQKFAAQEGEAAVLYARAVVETVTIGHKRFRGVLGRNTIANLDIVTDVNHHNDHPDFLAEIERAQCDDGRFRGVNRIVRVDSAASRLLQLADVVAYAPKWIVAEDLNAQGLRDHFGIDVL